MPEQKNKNSNGTEQFLKQKQRIVSLTETTYVDSVSGDFHRVIEQIRTSSTEPDFVKVYYRTMMASQDIDNVSCGFLMALSSVIAYVNDDSPIYFYNNMATRDRISRLCGIKDSMVSKYIKQCVASGILFKTEYKGTYEVNPWLIAKGRWPKIQKLQAHFDFIDGKWVRIIEDRQDDLDNQKAVPDE